MGHASDHYFVPEPSKFPIFGSIALLLMGSGAVMWLNGVSPGNWMVLAGFLVLVYMLFGWFGQVVRESEGGSYGRKVDKSFRWSMGWFIFSEVMFFAAFFGALFYVRSIGLPWLGDADNALLWPGFEPTWPNAGPIVEEAFTPMEAWGIPALNTLILLTSGATLTWAHWGLLKEKRGQLINGLALTILLGVIFLGFQAYEYAHAYGAMNLKLTTGIYGSTFFMLTGFHGLHVTIGAIMLTVMLFRSVAGHFTPHRHFAFEAAAWYWHFVDVVWLFLFVVVYWL
ncbi:MAG: cytochrome c oxidase subunit 3 [Rhodocyclaceae bacterium]|nr:cytochrome c oxidase subunit 3 [Rhodocyclaceae bacterium]MCB1926563.1 cytochrome c oxidase subunit 3 [Rhodocyclaceae bacterium]MCP5235192.1 cytochrome c oxidase subunit 3 [Zoogloeaceae bacterium]